MRVLTQIFPATPEELAKPLDWKKFLQAMEDAGLDVSKIAKHLDPCLHKH